MSYRVKTVCALTGIPRNTLLAWERRYPILELRRSPTGHRIYADSDVEVLKDLKRRVEGGLSISEAVRMQAAARAERTPVAEPRPDLVPTLLSALLDFDRATADHHLLAHPLPFRRAVDEVHLPLLTATGDGWAAGTVSIAQEHFVSGWVREQLFSLFHGLGGGPPTGPRAICALAPGEVHELALLAVAIHLVLDGWRVTWLGADLPIEELCRTVADEQPSMVCLSAMVGHPPERVLGWARELRAAAPAHTTVAVGGPCARGLRLPGVSFPEGAAALRAVVRGDGP